MSTALELADLIQLSIEEDVAEATVREGTIDRTGLDVVMGDRSYRIQVVRREAVVDTNEYEDNGYSDIDLA